MIDVILLCHNRLDNTIECIEALYENTSTPFKLTVIDDSTDLTPMYFADLAEKKGNVNYIRPTEPIKCGNQAINLGIRLTENPYIVFLGNSTFVEPFWLTEALVLMDKDPKVGLIGFKMLLPRYSTILEAGGFEEHLPKFFEQGHRYSFQAEVAVVAWAAVLLRREAVPEGGFDEVTYHGFRGLDDTDNCLEIRKRGWKIIYNGYGCIYHRPVSSIGASGREAIEAEENRQRFIKKWNIPVKFTKIQQGKIRKKTEREIIDGERALDRIRGNRLQ